jgi:O-antigen/teichoic acid export membrane protein
MKKILKNSFVVSLGTLLRKLAGFIFLIAIARFYPVSDFGYFNYVLAFVSLGLTFVDLGLEKYLSLKVVKKKHNINKYFNFGIALRGTVAVFIYLAMIGVAFLMHLEQRKIVGIAIYGLHLFPGLVFTTINNIYLGLEYFKGMFINFAGIAFFYLVTSLLTYFFKPELLLIFFIPPAAYLIMVVIDLLLINKHSISLMPSLKKIDFKKAVDSIWPFFVFYLFSIFYLRSDIILLGELQNDAAVAMYSSAFRIVEALLLLPQSIGRAFFPHISKKVIKKQAWFKEFKKGVGYLFAVSIPVSLGIYLFSPLVVNTFYGEQYSASIAVLRIFSLVNIFFFLNSIMSSVVMAADKLKQYLPWYFTGLIVNLVINLKFIPTLGYLAPAWGKLAAEAYFFITTIIFIFVKVKE